MTTNPISTTKSQAGVSVGATSLDHDHPGTATMRRGHCRPRQMVGAFLAAALVATASAAISAAPAGAAVPGYEGVETQTDYSSASSRTVTVTCPPGKRVVGPGGQVHHWDHTVWGHVVIDDIIPTATTVTVSAYEVEGGTSGKWALQATATCADPLPGLQIVSAVSASDSSHSKSVYARCPVNKVPVGTGMSLLGGLGQVLINDMKPETQFDSGGSLSRGVLAKAFEDETGTSANWSLRAYAVCATPPPGYEVVAVGWHAFELNPRSDYNSVPCGFPSTTKVPIGVGLDILGGNGQVLLGSVWVTSYDASVWAVEDPTGTAESWTVKTFAICANP